MIISLRCRVVDYRKISWKKTYTCLAASLGLNLCVSYFAFAVHLLKKRCLRERGKAVFKSRTVTTRYQLWYTGIYYKQIPHMTYIMFFRSLIDAISSLVRLATRINLYNWFHTKVGFNVTGKCFILMKQLIYVSCKWK